MGVIVASLTVAVSPVAASTTVIGFDDLPSGTVIDEQYAALGVHFGPSPFAGISGAFTAAARAQVASGDGRAAGTAGEPCERSGTRARLTA